MRSGETHTQDTDEEPEEPERRSVFWAPHVVDYDASAPDPDCVEYAPPMSSWTPTRPATEPAEIRAAQADGHFWNVVRDGDAVRATSCIFNNSRAPFEVRGGFLVLHRVVDGWLAASTATEWTRSEIDFFSENGAHRSHLSDDEAVAMFDVGPSVWLATHGAIFRAEHLTTYSWRLQRIAERVPIILGAVGETPSSALVIAWTRLARVTASGELINLHDGHWVQNGLRLPISSFAPSTTMAIDATGRVFIGARHAVIRLTPRDGRYDEEWLVPPSSNGVNFPTKSG